MNTTKRLRVIVPAAALSLLALAGCSSMSHGMVIGKAYHAEYTYITNEIISDGKTTTIIPEVIYVPECWGLELRDGPLGGPDTSEGEVCVDPAVYGPIGVGDYYGGDGS